MNVLQELESLLAANEAAREQINKRIEEERNNWTKRIAQIMELITAFSESFSEATINAINVDTGEKINFAELPHLIEVGAMEILEKKEENEEENND